MVGNGEVRPAQQKIEVVKDFPLPATKKDVRSFLGLTGYYRKFIPGYSTIALPLTDLTKKSAPTNVSWTDACETSFVELKRRLTSTPVLKSPDLSQPFVLQTDASERGVGAVLSQYSSDGEEHPVAISAGNYSHERSATLLSRKSALLSSSAFKHSAYTYWGGHSPYHTSGFISQRRTTPVCQGGVWRSSHTNSTSSIAQDELTEMQMDYPAEQLTRQNSLSLEKESGVWRTVINRWTCFTRIIPVSFI